MSVTGLRNVQQNLSNEISKIKGDTSKGIRAATLFVENGSNKIAPHDTGVLINSSFSNMGVTRRGDAVGTVGYTVKYAPFVHGASDDTNFQKTGAENKFLEKAVVRNFVRILNIIKKRVGR